MAFGKSLVWYSLAGWTQPAGQPAEEKGAWAIYQVSGDSSYGAGGTETIDVSSEFDNIDGAEGLGYPVSPQGAEWTALSVIDHTDPGAVQLISLEGDAESAPGRTLASAKWIIMLKGTKHYNAT